jgi:hypothetical protein
MKVINIYNYPDFAQKWLKSNIKIQGHEFLRYQGFKSARYDDVNVGWILDDDDYYMFHLLWGNRILYAPVKSN